MLAQANADLYDLLPTNKVVGILLGNDAEGMIQANPVRGCPPIFAARGYKVIDPGRFDLDLTDFSAQISAFKNANAEVLYALLPFPTFANFWAQAAQQGYKPKIGLIGKALVFASAANALGPRGKYLTVIAWWTPGHPFKSSLTGQSAKQFCDEYEEVTKKQWTQVIGFRHALFEVAMDVFKRAQNPESAASVIEAVRTARLDTVVGPVQWQGPPPNQWTQMPVKNVCTTPIVCGQWVPGTKWMYDLVVVDNKRYPLIPVQRKLVPLPA
jgi:branched-chain amino acid transport system substrate-binding protein